MTRRRGVRPGTVAGSGPAALLLAGLAAAGAACGPPPVIVEGDLAFVNVNVVPMDGERIVEGQTVVIDEGRIRSIDNAAHVEPAEGVEIVDAAGHYLMPGLAEMHGHLRTRA